MKQAKKPRRYDKIVLSAFLFLLIIFFSLRFLYLTQSLGIGSDAGRDFLTTWNIYTKGKFILIGPESQMGVFGHHFFFGPAPDYIILPAVVIGNGNNVVIASYLVLLNSVGLFLTLYLLYRARLNKWLIFIFGFFFTVTPAMVQMDRTFWNPYLMLPVSLLLLGVLTQIVRQSKHTRLLFLCLGILCGLGLQLHYSFVLAMTVAAITLLVSNKITIKNILIVLGGFFIGFAPLVLFELRNHFYNLTTLVQVEQKGGHQLGGMTVLNALLPSWFYIRTPSYYSISLLPFWYFLVSYCLTKIMRNKFLVGLVIVFLCVYSYQVIFPQFIPPAHGYDMVKGWNYSGLLKTRSIIEKEKPKNYNILDLLTGDDNAYALRYLLTIENFPPKGVGLYSRIHTLFIYTRLSENQLRSSNIAIDSAGPHKLIKKWSIQNGIFLYEIEYKNY